MSADHIILEAMDGKSFSLPKECVRLSGLLEKLLRAAGPQSLPVHVPVQVKSQLLSLVVEFLLHHQKVDMVPIPSPLRSTEMKLVVEDLWDAEFIEGVRLPSSGGSNQKLYGLITVCFLLSSLLFFSWELLAKKESLLPCVNHYNLEIRV